MEIAHYRLPQTNVSYLSAAAEIISYAISSNLALTEEKRCALNVPTFGTSAEYMRTASQKIGYMSMMSDAGIKLTRHAYDTDQTPRLTPQCEADRASGASKESRANLTIVPDYRSFLRMIYEARCHSQRAELC